MTDKLIEHELCLTDNLGLLDNGFFFKSKSFDFRYLMFKIVFYFRSVGLFQEAVKIEAQMSARTKMQHSGKAHLY